MDKKDKKIKNLISTVILLGGLLLGSLFVDVSQLATGHGFSQKNLNKSDIFQSGEKTWVAYTEPPVRVKVLADDSCTACDPTEFLVWLRRVMPTVSAEKVDYNSEAGKNLATQFGLKTIPAFVFSIDAEKTDFFAQAQPIFQKSSDSYIFNAQEVGLAPGKYLELPQVGENDVISGNKEAKVKVFIFSDFQCPYSAQFHQVLRSVMKEKADNVAYVFKNLPLAFHKQGENASLATECAGEQGKFWEYADKLFANQGGWQSTTGTAKFKTYATQTGLKADQFNQCLDNKKYLDKVNADKAEAEKFGVSGTPGIFVNDQFNGGVMSAEQLKASIDAQLVK